VVPWLATDALEGRLKACRSPRILHLATHGFFLVDQNGTGSADLRDLGASPSAGSGRLSGKGLENPLLRSGLALAGANTWLQRGSIPAEAEDGLLTAEDVTGLDLADTELVVLSACETGLGEIHVGEGVFGLRRAFTLAGARTLVMSLWKVPDRQTEELMIDFYQRIQAGQGRAEALREAQLALKARHPEPLYWAAFICQGDPRPLNAISPR
jgi:CHAT domain-containing protein